MNRFVLLGISVIILSACSSDDKDQAFYVKTEEPSISHIHGMGFIGEDLAVATHNGLLKYSEDEWYETTRDNHDYMGFTPFEEGFYASGHPEQGSKIENPLGLIKSNDQGKSIESLAFSGETDFHLLAASFEGETIYGALSQPNSVLTSPGLYRTQNEGEDWEQLSLAGLKATTINGLAVHPSNDEQLALSSEEGIFISNDFGETFSLIEGTLNTTGLTFTEDSLLFSANDGEKVSFNSYQLNQKEITLRGTLPVEPGNNLYLAVNPGNADEVWAAVENNLFFSNNGGATWDNINPGSN
ncbi:F510_1955 family glycosylhydrolase [Jeotgalibacillus malaysiensis]|uniref:F510_1955 family glycosylhydrolase n=1 Tax=Jeotgalibacillus malaysiensis TaxID=1508404 RepID=UPI00384C6F53